MEARRRQHMHPLHVPSTPHLMRMNYGRLLPPLADQPFLELRRPSFKDACFTTSALSPCGLVKRNGGEWDTASLLDRYLSQDELPPPNSHDLAPSPRTPLVMPDSFQNINNVISKEILDISNALPHPGNSKNFWAYRTAQQMANLRNESLVQSSRTHRLAVTLSPVVTSVPNDEDPLASAVDTPIYQDTQSQPGTPVSRTPMEAQTERTMFTASLGSPSHKQTEQPAQTNKAIRVPELLQPPSRSRKVNVDSSKPTGSQSPPPTTSRRHNKGTSEQEAASHGSGHSEAGSTSQKGKKKRPVLKLISPVSDKPSSSSLEGFKPRKPTLRTDDLEQPSVRPALILLPKAASLDGKRPRSPKPKRSPPVEHPALVMLPKSVYRVGKPPPRSKDRMPPLKLVKSSPVKAAKPTPLDITKPTSHQKSIKTKSLKSAKSTSNLRPANSQPPRRNTSRGPGSPPQLSNCKLSPSPPFFSPQTPAAMALGYPVMVGTSGWDDSPLSDGEYERERGRSMARRTLSDQERARSHSPPPSAYPDNEFLSMKSFMASESPFYYHSEAQMRKESTPKERKRYVPSYSSANGKHAIMESYFQKMSA